MIHRTAIAAAALLALAPAAKAFDIQTPDPDLKVRLDLTPKYSSGYRLKNPSAALTRFQGILVDLRVNSCNVATAVSMDCVVTNTSRDAFVTGPGQVSA